MGGLGLPRSQLNKILVSLMDPLAFYSRPGVMTDPGKHAYLLEGLPDDLASLCSVVQSNLVHVFWAERMGLNLMDDQKRTLQVHPVAEKLAIIAKTDGRPLCVPRPLAQRQVGNCRDFSVSSARCCATRASRLGPAAASARIFRLENTRITGSASTGTPQRDVG